MRRTTNYGRNYWLNRTNNYRFNYRFHAVLDNDALRRSNIPRHLYRSHAFFLSWAWMERGTTIRVPRKMMGYASLYSSYACYSTAESKLARGTSKAWAIFVVQARVSMYRMYKCREAHGCARAAAGRVRCR